MKLVADANVWYDIGTGRIDPDQCRSAQSDLFATPTSLLEIASGNRKPIPLYPTRVDSERSRTSARSAVWLPEPR